MNSKWCNKIAVNVILDLSRSLWDPSNDLETSQWESHFAFWLAHGFLRGDAKRRRSHIANFIHLVIINIFATITNKKTPPLNTIF